MYRSAACILLILSTICARGQGTRMVGVDEVIAQARIKAPEKLRAEALTTQASRWQQSSSAIFPSRPQLSLDYDTERPFGSNDFQFSVGISQELSLWGARSRSRTVAESFAKAAEAAQASVITRIDLTTRLLYNKAWSLSQQVALAEKLVVSSTSLVEASRRRLDAGDMSLLERNTIVLAANKQRIELERVSSNYGQALGELEALTGFDLQNATLTADTVPIASLPLDANVDYYLLSPDWVRLGNEIRIAEAQLELARVNVWPNPTIGLAYTRDRFSIEKNEIQYSGSTGPSISAIESFGGSVGLQLAIALPISIPGVWQPNMTSIAQREAMLLELQADQINLKIELAGKMARLSSQIERIQRALLVYQESLVLIVQNDELLSKGYEGGELSVTELLVGRQQLADMQSGQLDLIREFRDAEIFLRSLTR